MMYTDFFRNGRPDLQLYALMIIPIHTSLNKMDKSRSRQPLRSGSQPFPDLLEGNLEAVPARGGGKWYYDGFPSCHFLLRYPELLGGGQYMLIGNLIESQFISVGDWNFGSAISMILAVIILISMSLMKRMDKEKGE